MVFNKEKFMEFVKEPPRISIFNPIELEFSYGCMANSLSCNGIQEIDLTENERKDIIYKLMMWYKKHPEKLNNLLQYFIESNYTEYECSDKPCECCSDIVSTFKITI